MAYDPMRHHRRSVRLADYDYRQNGAYYITLCAHERECLFGEIADGAMRLSEYGEIVREEWERTALARANVILDAFVVMPNHVHGILVITTAGMGAVQGGVAGGAGAAQEASAGVGPGGVAGVGPGGVAGVGPGGREGMARHAPTPAASGAEPRRQFAQPLAGSLATILGAFKSAASRRVDARRGTPGWTVWQRNYHERIIQSADMLDKARRYIADNPARWADDVNHPAKTTRP